MSALETVYSVTQILPGGRREIFEFMVGRPACGWYRHEVHAHEYVSAEPCSVKRVANSLAESDRRLAVAELYAASAAMDRAQEGMIETAGAADADPDLWIMRRAMHVRRARLAVLDEVIVLCDRCLETEAADSAVPVLGMPLARLRRTVRGLIERDYPGRRDRGGAGAVQFSEPRRSQQ